MQMRWQAGMVQAGPDGRISGDIDAVTGLAEATVHLTLGGDAQHASARRAPVPVCRDTMAGLTALAMKTTVPATAASRDAAGAGTTDNH
ncbi:hypothetical protein [Paracoccus zhejiangensis]|uniref:hypothetical protein n=1 Tax=Paracoccus zhejiangensis TaxID=1077935 RepID=UPI001E37E144|nr:hypothetical protein [Paracoccus zhejiangensis]